MPNIVGIAYGLALVATAVAAWWYVPKHPDIWRTLPRERLAGTVAGVVALIWIGQMLALLLEGPLAKFRPLLWPFLIFIGVASFFQLDYLFTRAWSGLLLLVVNFLMHEAFVAHAPMRGVFSAFSYLLGTAAIYAIASPYRFRDLLRHLPERQALRAGVTTVLGLAGACTLITFLGAGGG